MEGTNSPDEIGKSSEGELEALLGAAKGLVEYLASQLAKEGLQSIPREDLVAYGQQGLLEAALRFDSERGTSFRTFAHYRVRGAMIDGARKMGGWSRRAFERVAMLRAANTASQDCSESGELAAAGSSEEAAEKLRKHMATMVTAMATGVLVSGGLQHVQSPPRPQDAADGTAPPPGRVMVADEAETPEELLGQFQLSHLVRAAVDGLPHPEDEVVRRFYIEGDNMDLIAQDLGKSRSWVSRVHTRALSRIESRLRRESFTLE